MSTIIQCASPGIGNRIKTYVSLFRSYDTVKTCNHGDSYIFKGLDSVSNDDLNKYPVISTEEYINNDMWRLKVFEHEHKEIEEYSTIDCLYEKTPQYFIDRYLFLFSKLKINDEIVDYVNNFTKNWNDVLGVHVRSWYCSRHILHDNSIFENEINKFDKHKKIFFCSDNSDVQSYFVQKYKNRIITYDRELYNTYNQAESGHNTNLQTTVDAFIEMFILSKCTSIIGTFASSFDEIAWWLSGCKSNVIIPLPANQEEYKNLYNSIILKK